MARVPRSDIWKAQIGLAASSRPPSWGTSHVSATPKLTFCSCVTRHAQQLKDVRSRGSQELPLRRRRRRVRGRRV